MISLFIDFWSWTRAIIIINAVSDLHETARPM